MAVVFGTFPGEARLQHFEQLTGIIRDISWRLGEQKRFRELQMMKLEVEPEGARIRRAEQGEPARRAPYGLVYEPAADTAFCFSRSEVTFGDAEQVGRARWPRAPVRLGFAAEASTAP